MDFARQSKVALRGTIAVWAAALLLMFFVSGTRWHGIAGGIALGSAGSVAIVWSMIRQTQNTADLAVGIVRGSAVFWLISRWAAAGATILFAVKWQLNVYAAGFGLLVGFVIVGADGYLRYLRMDKGAE